MKLKKKPIYTVRILIFLIFSINGIQGQDNEIAAGNEPKGEGSKSYLSIELDPAPFVLEGYSYTLKYSPIQLPHFAFMASIFGSSFPDKMMTSENQDKGWTDMQFEASYALWAEYFLSDNRTGAYFGGSVLLYNKSVTLEPTNEKISFRSFYPNLNVGYIWYPLSSSKIYFNPWFSIGSEFNSDEDNFVNDIEFNLNAFQYIAAIHVGYSFEL